MNLHGAPMLAQSPLTRLRSTTNDAELNAMAERNGRAMHWPRSGRMRWTGLAMGW